MVAPSAGPVVLLASTVMMSAAMPPTNCTSMARDIAPIVASTRAVPVVFVLSSWTIAVPSDVAGTSTVWPDFPGAYSVPVDVLNVMVRLADEVRGSIVAVIVVRENPLAVIDVGDAARERMPSALSGPTVKAAGSWHAAPTATSKNSGT